MAREKRGRGGEGSKEYRGRRKEEGGRRKVEGGRRKEEGGRWKEEGGRRKVEGEREGCRYQARRTKMISLLGEDKGASGGGGRGRFQIILEYTLVDVGDIHRSSGNYPGF
jgi:hypothetical protein